MAKPSRLPSVCAAQTYFVTSDTWQRRLYFHNGPLADLLIETIYRYREQKRFLLHSFVIMSDHVHLVITPDIESTLERAVQLIKGGFSYRVKKERGSNIDVWQRGFTDRRIRNSGECCGVIEYIHQNPVKARLVARAEDFQFSSANPKFEVDPLPEYLRG
jgi:putative transposase